ncbi:MAG: hypothetical protein CO120_01755 [Gammaproteobacteria bacterium CG_4_9_14_3_um_filter_38_9]|nr:MAG: hypothetical protein CO120_01755 [Gammaproteobacteria bacterium CG_4_9_14_3_um_filter_38_9]
MTTKRAKKIKSFTEVQEWAQKKGFINSRQWYDWHKSNKKPKNIPLHPNRVFTDEWQGWPHFFGRKDRTNARGYLSYQDAVVFNRKHKIKSVKEYKAFLKDCKNCNLPKTPNYFYGDEWRGWGDYLCERHVSLGEIVKIIDKLNIGTWRQWVEYSKTKRPPEVPGDIFKHYNVKMSEILAMVEERRSNH